MEFNMLYPKSGQQNWDEPVKLFNSSIESHWMFIGCNAPGWVTEFQHPGGYVPYVDPKPEEMQEYV